MRWLSVLYGSLIESTRRLHEAVGVVGLADAGAVVTAEPDVDEGDDVADGPPNEEVVEEEDEEEEEDDDDDADDDNDDEEDGDDDKDVPLVALEATDEMGDVDGEPE